MSIFNSNLGRRFASLKTFVSDWNRKHTVLTKQKGGTDLECMLLEVNHMSRPELFYLDLTKLAFFDKYGLPL
jgi:hypothetical protein